MNAALGPKSGASTRAIARIDLLSTQEVRTVHYEAMTPVWNVAPHPHATPAETPGNWRKHDIAPFPEGMTPPPFPEIASDGRLGEGREQPTGAQRRRVPRTPGKGAQRLRADPPIPRRQRSHRSIAPQLAPGAARLSPSDRVQERAHEVPGRDAQGGPGRRRPAG